MQGEWESGCYQICPGRGGGAEWGCGGGLGTRAAVSLALILTLVCPLRSDQGAVVSPKRTPGLTKGFFKHPPAAHLRDAGPVLSTRGRPFHRPDHLGRRWGGPHELHFADRQPKPRLEGCCRSGAHLTSGPPRDIAGRGRARQRPLGVDRAHPASPAQRAPRRVCLTLCVGLVPLVSINEPPAPQGRCCPPILQMGRVGGTGG